MGVRGASFRLMHDIAALLKAHDPFGGLDADALERLAETAQVESFTAGTVTFKQGERPQTKVRVVRLMCLARSGSRSSGLSSR